MKTPIYRTTLVCEGEMSSRFIRGPEDVAEFVSPFFESAPSEILLVLLLNTAARVIGVEEVSRGGLAASIVEPRAVFRTAILGNAASIVCAHNHPSGNPEPSAEDIAITRQLVDGGNLLAVPVRDHVIWTRGGFTSLARRGLI